MISTVANVIIGIALLTMGRMLFWVFVGAAGFVLGRNFALHYLTGQPEWVVLAVSVAVGLAGIFIAIFAQKLAVAVAGFVMGGYAVMSVFTSIGLTQEVWMWGGTIIGGIIGALLALFLFNPALIGLSSIAGAILIVEAASLKPPLDLLLLVVLAIVGIIIQTKQLSRQKMRSE